jgi:hypothetical protein
VELQGNDYGDLFQLDLINDSLLRIHRQEEPHLIELIRCP